MKYFVFSFLTSLFVLSYAPKAFAEAHKMGLSEDIIMKQSAVGRKPGFVLPNDPKKLDFNFHDMNETKLWLNDDGTWHIEGKVKHKLIRCATYELGARFGKGNPRCTNVKWLTGPQYATSIKQCNSTLIEHKGYQTSEEAKIAFDQITCAQMLLKCNGTCNLTTSK